MKKTGLSTLLQLLFVLFLFALTGCGASNKAAVGAGAENGSLAAKLVWGGTGKSAAKSVASVPLGVTKVRLTVSGAGIPVVRNELAVVGGTTGQGEVDGIYPGSVSLVVQALDSTGVVLYEGFALHVLVASGAQTDVGTINMTAPQVKAADVQCIGCHETTIDGAGQNLVAEFKQSGHYTNQAFVDANGVATGCAGCHGPSHNTPDPSASGRCAECHVPTLADSHHAGKYLLVGGQVQTTICSTCHNSHNPFGPFVGGSCVACHEFGQDKTAEGNYVNDNNGVRAIVPEFRKTSHHIFNGAGIDPTDAQCAVCHLEARKTAAGTYGGVDPSKHMSDGKIHLRNCNKTVFPTTNSADANDFQWNPANPDHSAMDNFCFSCHNAAGAADAYTISGSSSALNPFNDLVTTSANGYDKQGRTGGVVAVYEQFDPNNVSHHGVRGKRYSTRSSATALANGAANSVTAAGLATKAAGGFFAATQKTLYDGGLMTSDYTPLGAPAVVADDSTLHCGDCHTVGQWSAAAPGYNGKYNKAVIGAHGSVNEYMLRNNVGTDQIHGLSSFVCFNCHNDKAAGDDRGGYYASAFWNQTSSWRAAGSGVYNGALGMRVHVNSLHAGAVGSTTSFRWPGTVNAITGLKNFVDANKPFESSGCIGGTAGIAYSTYTGSVAYVNTATVNKIGRNNVTNGNIMGIGCLNCHNSGRTGFGGIHGSNATYTTGWSFATATPVTNSLYTAPSANTVNGFTYASTQSVYRFMPGNANYGYIPPNSGFVGGEGTGASLRNVGAPGKAAWEWNGGTTVSGSCYTNNATNGAVQNSTLNGVTAVNGGDSPTWSGCNHHSADRADRGGAGRNSAIGNIGRTLYY